MRKVKKDVVELVKVGALVGVGSTMVSKVSGSTMGLSTVSGFLPVVGTAVMGGHIIRLTDEALRPRKRRRRRR